MPRQYYSAERNSADKLQCRPENFVHVLCAPILCLLDNFLDFGEIVSVCLRHLPLRVSKRLLTENYGVHETADVRKLT